MGIIVAFVSIAIVFSWVALFGSIKVVVIYLEAVAIYIKTKYEITIL